MHKAGKASAASGRASAATPDAKQDITTYTILSISNLLGLQKRLIRYDVTRLLCCATRCFWMLWMLWMLLVLSCCGLKDQKEAPRRRCLYSRMSWSSVLAGLPWLQSEVSENRQRACSKVECRTCSECSECVFTFSKVWIWITFSQLKELCRSCSRSLSHLHWFARAVAGGMRWAHMKRRDYHREFKKHEKQFSKPYGYLRWKNCPNEDQKYNRAFQGKNTELLLLCISWLVHGKDYETTATHTNTHTHYVALPILQEGVASLVSESFFSEVSRINVKKIRCETGGRAWSFHLSYFICILSFCIHFRISDSSWSNMFHINILWCTAEPSVNAALQGRWFFMLGILVIPVPCCACCCVFAVMRMRRKKDSHLPLSIVELRQGWYLSFSPFGSEAFMKIAETKWPWHLKQPVFLALPEVLFDFSSDSNCAGALFCYRIQQPQQCRHQPSPLPKRRCGCSDSKTKGYIWGARTPEKNGPDDCTKCFGRIKLPCFDIFTFICLLHCAWFLFICL